MKITSLKNTPRNLLIRILYYIIGSAVIAFGCSIFMISNTGTDCFGMFMQGLAETLEIPYTFSHIGINVAILIVLFFFGRSYIKLGTFVSLFIMGPVIDLTVLLVGGILTDDLSYAVRLLAALASLPVTSFGLAVIITADVGIGPNDLLSVFLSEKLHFQYRFVRIAVDITWVILGVFLGGTLGIMTIVSAFLVGPISAFFLKPADRLLTGLLKENTVKKTW